MTAAPGDLGGRVALVTGAGGEAGIGFACARQLGALGASVMVTSTTERAHARAAELTAAGVQTEAHTADLTDSAQAAELVAATLDRFGRLDVLVNNAGMTSVSDTEQPATVAELDDDGWHSAIDRNLSSAFYVTRAALAPMREARFGRVINIASTSGPVNAYPGDAAYHAAKAGVVGLTRALAIEVAGDGITANAIAPGWIATPSISVEAAAHGAATPIGRSGRPDEVAAIAALLAAPEASYLTGQLITVDGGNSAMETRGHPCVVDT